MDYPPRNQKHCKGREMSLRLGPNFFNKGNCPLSALEAYPRLKADHMHSGVHMAGIKVAPWAPGKQTVLKLWVENPKTMNDLNMYLFAL